MSASPELRPRWRNGLGAQSRVGRLFQRLTLSPAFRRYGPRLAAPLDRAVFRLTGGRLVVSRLLIPILMLTCTGRRDGRPRRVPLATLPEPDGSYLVVGSNFGRERHPGWTEDLLADPRGTVDFGGRHVAVEARLLDPAAKGAVWARLLRVWPAYAEYERLSGRDLRVFRLVPVAGPA